MGQNKIYVRFENLADKFDAKKGEEDFVNVLKFSREFYKEANPMVSEEPNIEIKELNLSGVMLAS